MMSMKPIVLQFEQMGLHMKGLHSLADCCKCTEGIACGQSSLSHIAGLNIQCIFEDLKSHCKWLQMVC